MQTAIIYITDVFHFTTTHQTLVRVNSDLEEVLDTFWTVAAAFTTDPFHFLHLSRLARRLDVLEVHFGVLAEVDDGTKEVEQTCTYVIRQHI